jgi:membrane protease YdiL (CAAX protease family)
MRKSICKFKNILISKDVKSIFIFVFIIQFISFGLVLLKDFFEIYSVIENDKFYDSNFELILSALIVAPIIETFVNQFLIFKLLKNLDKSLTIFFSALFFSILHYFKNNDLYEIFILFFNGLIFSYAYNYYLNLKRAAYVNLVIIHSLCNLPLVIYTICYNMNVI